MKKTTMNVVRISMVFVVLVTPGQASADQDQYSFGQAFDFGKAVEISKTNLAAENIGQRIAITGQIASVCEKSHCWMKLVTRQGQDFRIKVEDQIMVFPISAKDKSVFAEGVLEEWPQPEKPTRSYQLRATSVFIVH